MSEIFTDGKKKIMVCESGSISQEIAFSLELAGMMGLATSAGWDLTSLQRRDPQPMFKWRDDPTEGRPWRSAKMLAERKRKKGKVRARKKKRGY